MGMTFEQSQSYVLLFGKYCGKSLEEVASTDYGLRDLDWLRGQSWVQPSTKEAIDTYLNHGPIARELEQLIGE
jgi:hypothetical protein